ncbi:PD-(D/E)XK nuclease family protein [Aerococcaceae bacterium zg-BR9]|uniref:PD-(D/E)XK nuclease family protein n=1 Tax=Aerococcaceae bacterium zg-1292 TaxID=2774330 RepID=UPI004064A484|nr:PD-(D/E)XK nuclease family protein [Aerococcaceae bacterium zg-BR9]
MALQIVTGNLTTNKKKVIIEKLLSIKADKPNAKIFYLVPEHIKFDMETTLLSTMQQYFKTQAAATLDIQVVSFTRLNWFLLQQQGKQQENVSQIGISMLIRQILEQEKEHLIVYKGQHRHQGFVEKLRVLFEELLQGNITPDSLVDASVTLGDFKAGELENQRLSELRLLYQKFCQQLDAQNVGNYQSFEQLERYFSKQERLLDNYIVIDHHYFFNSQQYRLIVDFIRAFDQVWLTLPLTHREAIQLDWHPVVAVPKATYQTLHQLSRLFKFELMPDWDIHQPEYDYFPAIRAVAKWFKDAQSFTGVGQNLPSPTSNTHHFWQFDSIQNEIRHISNQIHYLVAKEGYRYQDILVVARDMDRYQQIVGPYFEMNQIPYFYDHEASMSQHPFVLWLESYFRLYMYRWQYQDLMLVIKSDLLLPPWLNEAPIEEIRHQKGLLETILLANGFFGYRFYEEQFEWQFPQQDESYQDYKGIIHEQTMGSLVNQWRQWLVETLYHPFNQWQQRQTGIMASTWLYQLLERSGVKHQLMMMRDQAIELGHIEMSQRLEQVWHVLMNTLDEFHLLYGEKQLDLALFSELLTTGLTQATYHIIPPTMDQVTITSLDSPQVKPAKICFAIGMDDLTLPRYVQSDSLLTQANRESIQERLLPYQSIRDFSVNRNQMELLMTQQLLLNASEQLYISYASTVNGQGRALSPLLDNVRKVIQQPLEMFNEEEHPLFQQKTIHTNQLGRAAMLLSPVLSLMRTAYQHSQSLTSIQLRLVNYLLEQPIAKKQHWQQLIRQLFQFHALPTNLSTETALQLFGRNIIASVSKIEHYYQDPFSHYLIYGLRLKEREQYTIDAAKTGDYFHSVLDSVMRLLIHDEQRLADVSSDTLKHYLEKALQAVNQEWRFNLFDSHPRMQAIRLQLDQQLWHFLQFSQRQHQLTHVQTVQTEAIFGLNQTLSGFKYPLESGGKLYITGKIDRIDTVASQQKLQVIDYKSGQKQFDLSDAYYGLDLQILTYLNVALKNYKSYTPLGAFYQPLIHQYQEATRDILSQDALALSNHLLQEHVLNGFVTVTPDELETIEPTFADNKKSMIYPVSTLKSGNYSSASSYIGSEDLARLLQMTNQRFIQAAQAIQSGEIQLAPYKDYPYTTALQPQYRVISGFDATEHYHLYRHRQIESKEVLSILKEEEAASHD